MEKRIYIIIGQTKTFQNRKAAEDFLKNRGDTMLIDAHLIKEVSVDYWEQSAKVELHKDYRGELNERPSNFVFRGTRKECWEYMSKHERAYYDREQYRLWD